MKRQLLPSRGNSNPERGSDSLVVVGLGGLLVLILCGLIAGMRWADTTSTVDQVAAAAARDASLQRDPAQGTFVAQQSVQSWAATQKLQCRSLRSTVDASGFQALLGTTGLVRVTVSCDVSFSDLYLPGMPGSATITKSATSAIDAFRER
ncbi:pilus assembly protein [Arthrobacter woluwensis]|uniref:pilus assembly protein n=1 Tax=Arthrobacter woluwensis TaxID=156980 RepID=UPI0037F13990